MIQRPPPPKMVTVTEILKSYALAASREQEGEVCVENSSPFNISGKCFLCWCVGAGPAYFFFPVLLNP